MLIIIIGEACGYKIKEPWTIKRVINLLKAIALFAIIIAAIWFFPPTNKLIVNFYEENKIIKAIIDVILKLIKGIFNSIFMFFKNLF